MGKLSRISGRLSRRRMAGCLPLSGFRLPVALILFTCAAAMAQKSAEDYYHGASAMYIEGRMQQALIEAEEGLRQYPEDEKLSMLEEHLKKLKEQQKQENDRDREKQDKGEDKEQEKEQDQEKEESAEEEPQEDSTAAEEDSPPDEAERDSSENMAEPDSIPEGEMSEEDAKRLLESYKEDEKENLKKTRKKKRKKTGIDW